MNVYVSQLGAELKATIDVYHQAQVLRERSVGVSSISHAEVYVHVAI